MYNGFLNYKEDYKEDFFPFQYDFGNHTTIYTTMQWLTVQIMCLCNLNKHFIDSSLLYNK